MFCLEEKESGGGAPRGWRVGTKNDPSFHRRRHRLSPFLFRTTTPRWGKAAAHHFHPCKVCDATDLSRRKLLEKIVKWAAARELGQPQQNRSSKKALEGAHQRNEPNTPRRLVLAQPPYSPVNPKAAPGWLRLSRKTMIFSLISLLKVCAKLLRRCPNPSERPRQNAAGIQGETRVCGAPTGTTPFVVRRRRRFGEVGSARGTPFVKNLTFLDRQKRTEHTPSWCYETTRTG